MYMYIYTDSKKKIKLLNSRFVVTPIHCKKYPFFLGGGLFFRLVLLVIILIVLTIKNNRIRIFFKMLEV